MNRPRITKQTLKELRGELLAKQQSQEQVENAGKEQSALNAVHEHEINVNQENEHEMNL